jgi:hypothetical protein
MMYAIGPAQKKCLRNLSKLMLHIVGSQLGAIMTPFLPYPPWGYILQC